MSYWPRSPENTSLRRTLAFARPHLHARRTEDVPRIAHAHGDAGQQLALRVVGDGIEQPQRRLDVLEVVQRLDALPLACVRAFRVAHREVRRIAQQDGHQVGAGLVGVDRPAKAALHEQRQAPAMIDVRMAQDHGVDGGGIERKRQAVARRRIVAALDHAAVEQQLAARHPQDVAGTRYFASGSEKLQLHAGHTLTSPHPEHSGARHERPSHPRVSTAALSSRRASPPVSSAVDWFSASATRTGARAGGAGDAGRTLAPNAFVRVAPDDTITVVIGKSEMGQGIYTGLAMALAEELDVDPARVTVEFAGADPAFNVPFMPIQFTGGSMSTSTTYTQLREAGARARAMLLAAAAQKWNVDAADAAHRKRQGFQRLEIRRVTAPWPMPPRSFPCRRK